MVKIKLKKGIIGYTDAFITLKQDQVIELAEGWYLQQLLKKNIIEIIRETKKQEKPEKKQVEEEK